MTTAEINLVRDSFRKILPVADQVAALFYARLFELDPALRTLFRGDMGEQGRKLMSTISVAVDALDRPGKLDPIARRLAARQAAHNVRQNRYATIGAAFLWTIGKRLGPDFTPAVRAAWTSAYYMLANAVIESAREEMPTPRDTFRVEVAA
jgi:hemoglobin-like flavoprotein